VISSVTAIAPGRSRAGSDWPGCLTSSRPCAGRGPAPGHHRQVQENARRQEQGTGPAPRRPRRDQRHLVPRPGAVGLQKPSAAARCGSIGTSPSAQARLPAAATGPPHPRGGCPAAAPFRQGRPEPLAADRRKLVAKTSTRCLDREDERADHPSPLHQPGNLHALANRRPIHQRTASPPAREDPQEPDRRTGNRRSPQPPSSSRISTVNGCPQEGSQLHLPVPRAAGENRASREGSRITEQQTRRPTHCLSPGEMFNVSFNFIIPITYTATSNAG
jgi:hypothetical protein